MCRVLAKWLPVLLAVAACSVHAGSLRVGPTLVYLDAKQPVAALRVTNNNTQITGFEVRAMAWRQADNQDVYGDTSELIVTPPVFELAPGDSQIVRAGLTNAKPAPTDVPERAFRIFIAELPAPTAQDDPRIQTLMRVGVPVFTRAYGEKTALHWRLGRDASGSSALQVSNAGNAHARILKVAVEHDGSVLDLELPGLYVLSNATREWQLPHSISPGEQVNLRVTSREGTHWMVLNPFIDGDRH